ncbi:MAG TPA: hypothetical protein VK762_37845, partial [Polyangiaceae bacterium]|nr:hypothetical protein [Polyangiaceae bacterium]
WNQPFFGESHFVGPNGPVVDVSTHPELIVADLDLGELAAGDPSGWNLPRDVRPEIYRLGSGEGEGAGLEAAALGRVR